MDSIVWICSAHAHTFWCRMEKQTFKFKSFFTVQSWCVKLFYRIVYYLLHKWYDMLQLVLPVGMSMLQIILLLAMLYLLMKLNSSQFLIYSLSMNIILVDCWLNLSQSDYWQHKVTSTFMLAYSTSWNLSMYTVFQSFFITYFVSAFTVWCNIINST